MSMGPLGIAGSAAGAPLAQAKGTDVERAQQDTTHQQRQVATDQKAENAAGIAAADEDQEASDRDADGRRLWEQGADKPDETAEGDAAREARQSKDPTGQSGTTLDLTG